MSDRKQFEWAVKAIDNKKGIVTAVVAVFSNVDAQKDRILPGAFTNSITKWKARMQRGEFLPVVYGHQDDPTSILGKAIDLRETVEGLEVDEQFFLGKPKARDTFDAIVAGVLPRSSFAYDVIQAKSNPHGGLDLRELDVIEVGSTLYPANDLTRTVGVKDKHPLDGEVVEAFGTAIVQAFTKAGRVVSAATERKFRDRISGMEEHLTAMKADLDELTSTGDGGGKADEFGMKAEEPQVKAEEFPVLAAARAMFDG